MTEESNRSWPPAGTCVRVVYSVHGQERFAVGILLRSEDDRIILRQQADQFGPVQPFHLTVRWPTVIRLTMDGPAARTGLPGWCADS